MNFNEIVEKVRRNRQRAAKTHNRVALDTLQRLEAVKERNQLLAINETDKAEKEKRRKKKKG